MHKPDDDFLSLLLILLILTYNSHLHNRHLTYFSGATSDDSKVNRMGSPVPLYRASGNPLDLLGTEQNSSGDLALAGLRVQIEAV